MENLEKISLKIFCKMFEGEKQVAINGKKYPIEKYSKSGVKHVDILNYRFIEQNPEKDSHWAEKARNGQNIMWILKDWDYIGQVYEGKFRDFRK